MLSKQLLLYPSNIGRDNVSSVFTKQALSIELRGLLLSQKEKQKRFYFLIISKNVKLKAFLLAFERKVLRNTPTYMVLFKSVLLLNDVVVLNFSCRNNMNIFLFKLAKLSFN